MMRERGTFRRFLTWHGCGRLILALTLGTIPLLIGSTPSASAGGAGRGAVYVALGDSYAAGEGLGGFEPGTDIGPKGSPNSNPRKNLCHRSSKYAYGSLDRAKPIVLPHVTSASRSFWACSGARTTDIFQGQGSRPVTDPYYQASQPAQQLTVNSRTQWISLSIGGNDIGFSDIGRACAAYTTGATVEPIPKLSNVSCATAIASGEKALPKLLTSLKEVYAHLLDRSPRAVLAVVGYPRVFPSNYSRAYNTRDGKRICLTNVVYQDSTNGALLGVGVQVKNAKALDGKIIVGLNRTAASAVKALESRPKYKNRIVFANPYAQSTPQSCTGHTTGLTVNGVVISAAGRGVGPKGLEKYISTATFHPTKTGQAILGQAVQSAFEATRLRLAAGSMSITGLVGDRISRSDPILGGVPPIRVDLSKASTVPTWLKVGVQNQKLVVSATPPTSGHWHFGATVSDAHGQSARLVVDVTVHADAYTAPTYFSAAIPSDYDPSAVTIDHDGGKVTYTVDGESFLYTPTNGSVGIEKDGQPVSDAIVSADGNFLAYTDAQPDYPDDLASHVYQRDLRTGVDTRVSPIYTPPSDSYSDYDAGGSWPAAQSADGRNVVYGASGSDGGGYWWMKDTGSSSPPALMSRDTSGVPRWADISETYPTFAMSISPSGRYLAHVIWTDNSTAETVVTDTESGASKVLMVGQERWPLAVSDSGMALVECGPPDYYLCQTDGSMTKVLKANSDSASPNGRFVVTTDGGCLLGSEITPKVLDTVTGDIIDLGEVPCNNERFVVSDDGDVLVYDHVAWTKASFWFFKR